MPIVSYVPLFMFAILFGLSMDYEVFLVTQIEEHVRAGEDNRTVGRRRGMVTSARVITAAAAIMVFVFGSFVLNGDPDRSSSSASGSPSRSSSTPPIVRCLLVPALMVLMGKHQLVPAALARTAPPAYQHRGSRVLQVAQPAQVGRVRARGNGRSDRLLSVAAPSEAAGAVGGVAHDPGPYPAAAKSSIKR